MAGAWDTRNVVRLFNGVGALVVFSVVIGAYGIQFIFLEPPCPLCLLIRIGMLATGFGLTLNALFGPRPIHYGFALMGAVFGILVSLRNIALHIVPGTGSYGDAVFGFHLYTWAFLVFMAIVIAIAVVMFFQRQFDEPAGDAPTINWGPLAARPLPAGSNASGRLNSPDAVTAGMASKNDNRNADSRVRPTNSPALAEAPDRETPGISARHCARPITTASRIVTLSRLRCWVP